MSNIHIIYKYRSFEEEYHLDCLLNQELYFAPSNKLNDPFDLNINPDFTMLDTDDKILEYTRFYLSSLDILPEISKMIDISVLERNIASDIKADLAKAQSDFNKVSNHQTNRNFGVVSFSINGLNNVMWAHYSNNHKGFVIGYNKFILNQFNSHPLIKGMVEYKASYPKVSPIDTNSLELMKLKSLSKSIEWSYEEEFRLVKIISNEEDRKFKTPIESIEEVILGKEVSESNTNIVFDFCTKHKIKLYKTSIDRTSFNLIKNPLN